MKNVTSALSTFFGSDLKWCYNITIINDQVLEGDETLTVVLFSIDPDVRILNNVSVISIIDDGDDSKFLSQSVLALSF